MNCESHTLDSPQQFTPESNALALAFGLGWACADTAHLPVLPEAIARMLQVPGVRVVIMHGSGKTFMEHTYPAPEKRMLEGLFTVQEVEVDLGRGYQLRIGIEALAELADEQEKTLTHVVWLIRSALECVLLRQNEREALGAPFNGLSDREWEICLALQQPNGEKQIADTLACSRHTVHGAVKSLYRIMGVQSRLQLLEQLKSARDRMRCGALATLGEQMGARARRVAPTHARVARLV